MKKKNIFGILGIALFSFPAVSVSADISNNLNRIEKNDALIKQSNQEITVYTFEELKNALTQDNGIENINLGSDIILENGININSSKISISLDGKGHKLIEKNKGVNGTIYVSNNNGTKKITLKNLLIDGKNFYGPVNVSDAVNNVSLNYENISYTGPQLIHNIHGYANFSGENDIHILTNGSDSDKGQELFEGLGVNISGKFNLKHEGTTDSAFWFGLGADAIPYLNITPDSEVTMDILHNTLFYVDFSDKYPLDVNVGENSKFKIQTKRELFRLGHARNIKMSEKSNTEIMRYGNVNNTPTIKLVGSTFSLSPQSKLTVNHSSETAANIFEASKNSTINFNSASLIDLRANIKAKVFNAKDTMLNLRTNRLYSWQGGQEIYPDYSYEKTLISKIKLTSAGAELIEGSLPDLLDNWKVKETTHLILKTLDDKNMNA